MKTREPAKMLEQVALQLDRDTFRQRFRGELAAPCHLPSALEIGDLLLHFQHLLFPSVFSIAESPTANSNRLTERLLEKFQTQLQRLVDWTMGGVFDAAAVRSQTQSSAAEEIVPGVLNRLPAIAALLATDVQAAVDGDPACQNASEVVICYPGFHALMVHRLAHEVWQAGGTLLARMIAEWSHSRSGIDIHPQAHLGNHLFIDHGTGVVIGQTCRVGNHVKIYQGVTLGALSFPKDASGQFLRHIQRHPTIEDHVVIYANSTILGGETVVGHHSVIGSSVWLTESVDPYTTVVMEKPRLRFRSQQPTAFDPPADYQI